MGAYANGVTSKLDSHLTYVIWKNGSGLNSFKPSIPGHKPVSTARRLLLSLHGFCDPGSNIARFLFFNRLSSASESRLETRTSNLRPDVLSGMVLPTPLL